MLRVGLLGLGNMGRTLLRSLTSGALGPYQVALVTDVDPRGAEAAAAAGVRFADDPAELLRLDLDLVVETASQAAVREWAEPLLRRGTSLMILSVGAFADPALLGRLEQAAEAGNARVHVPSGAIGGLDVLKAAAAGGLHSVHLTTTKPPAALAGAPAVAGLDLHSLQAATTVFEGTAAGAAGALPQNLNVAVALALAGIGVEQTGVTVVADPAGSTNSHRVTAEGEFGRLELVVHNVPSPDNPRTSYLAVLSAMALLRGLHQRIRIGA